MTSRPRPERVEVHLRELPEDYTLALFERVSEVTGCRITVVVDPAAPEHCPCGCTEWRGWARKA